VREMGVDRDTSRRWLSREKIKGLAFRLNDRVKIITGPHSGEVAYVVTPKELGDDPLYLVETKRKGEDVHLRESCLQKDS